MAWAHTEAALNIISLPELSFTDVNLRSQIAKLITEVTGILAHYKKLETDVAIVNNVNNTLVKTVVTTERHCWGNAWYLRKDMLEVAGLLKSVRNNVLQWKVFEVFQETDEDICDSDIHVRHCLKDKDRAIFKFAYRKFFL